MARRTTIGTHFVDVPKSATRRERTAALDVRIGRVTLHLHEHGANHVELDTYVVWAHERRGPRGQERLDWMLFTNRPVNSFAEASAIIASYCHPGDGAWLGAARTSAESCVRARCRLRRSVAHSHVAMVSAHGRAGREGS